MSAPVAEGQVLAGKYRVERILGQGGMGVVVAATHEQLQQKVALKFLLGATPTASVRFQREARDVGARQRCEQFQRSFGVALIDERRARCPRDAKFVVSPQAPVRQIWVSAMSRSFKLQWDADRSAFVLGEESLADLLNRLCREFLAS